MNTRCRARNPVNCRVHGQPVNAAVAAQNMNAYFAAREAEDERKKQEEKQYLNETLTYVNNELDHVDWEDYSEKVRNLITKMSYTHGAPQIGRTRAVFDMGNGYIMKVPFTDEGELANSNEARACKTVDAFIPVAQCYYETTEGVDVLMMEKVEMVEVDYKSMPDWVGYVDCGQVGLNRKGELVAYDL